MFLDGVGFLLKHFKDNIKWHDANDLQTALSTIESNDLNLLLFDFDSLNINSKQLIAHINRSFPKISIIVFTAPNKLENIQHIHHFGADAVVHKSTTSNVFLKLIEHVIAREKLTAVENFELLNQRNYEPLNQTHLEYNDTKADIKSVLLTPRQKEVLTCLSQGLSNKEIALKLNITEATTKVHVTAIFKELNVNSRMKAAKVIDSMKVI